MLRQIKQADHDLQNYQIPFRQATYHGNGLLLYQNPTYGDFSINLGEKFELVTITMTDLSGKIIQSKTYNNEQLLYLKIEESAGVYLLVIESGDKKAVIKLVKE